MRCPGGACTSPSRTAPPPARTARPPSWIGCSTATTPCAAGTPMASPPPSASPPSVSSPTARSSMPVTRFEIMLRRPLAGEPAYVQLKGGLHFAIDPLHPANRRITDVDLAPRNAQGRVEWDSDVSILLPVD